jgi:hypothetical protein
MLSLKLPPGASEEQIRDALVNAMSGGAPRGEIPNGASLYLIYMTRSDKQGVLHQGWMPSEFEPGEIEPIPDLFGANFFHSITRAVEMAKYLNVTGWDVFIMGVLK